jgi:diguanylate cyclase (GGDEF)-like protein
VPETDIENTLILAEKLRKTIEDKKKNNYSNITASFGVSTCKPSDTPESLVKRADEALLQAKRNGKNRVEVG